MNRAEPAAETPTKGLTRPAAALLAVGGVMVVGFTRLSWMTASYFDDRAGGGEVDVSGAQWSTEASAVSLLLVIAAVAVLALRRRGRRIVGAVAALAAAAAVISPLRLLAAGTDVERVHTILTAGYEDMQARSGSIASWAEITGVTLHPLNPALMILGCVIAFVGGVLAAACPGADPATLNKYETEAVRREKIEDDLASSPDSGRVMWDALDADLDPTQDPRSTGPGNY